MGFGSSLTDRTPATEQKKFESPFLRLTSAEPEATIRILDDDVTTFWRYWLPVNLGDKWDGRPVIVGRNSPIREYMNSLDKKDSKYRAPQMRAYVNVLDRTPKDGQPLNKVKIWELGRELVEALQVFDGRQINRQDYHKMRLQEFDIVLVRVERRGNDGNMYGSTVPSPSFNDEPLPQELLDLPRYDLVKMTQPMPDEAQIRLLNGENYSEVRKSLGWDSDYPMIQPNEIPF